MSAGKQALMKSGKVQEASYNRFFVNAFTEQDIDEIVEQGGAKNKENFKQVSKKNVKEKGYWDAMFNNKFKGKDGKVRDSKFNRLGDAVFEKYFKGLQDERVSLREYSRQGKQKTFYRVRKVVAKGQKVDFKGRTYRGGQFLPQEFKLRKK